MSEIALSSTEEIDVPVTRKDTDLFATMDDLRPCPECGMTYHGTVGLAVHRSIRHGVAGKKPGDHRPKKKLRKVVKKTQLPTKAAEYDTPDWTADEIFTSVVAMLYPAGAVPVQALPTLIEWRTDTERMLRSLP